MALTKLFRRHLQNEKQTTQKTKIQSLAVDGTLKTWAERKEGTGGAGEAKQTKG